MDLHFIPPILLLVFSSLLILSLRQMYFLNQINLKLGYKNNILIFLSGLSALITPGGGGEAIKFHYVKKNFSGSYSQTLPIIVLERLFDLSAIIFIVGIISMFVEIPESNIVVIVLFLFIIGIFTIIRNSKLFNRLIKIGSRINFLKKNFSQMTQSHSTITKIIMPRPVMVGFGLSLIAWILQAFAIYLCFQAFQLNTDFLYAVSLTFTSIVIGVMTFIPGGLGVAELTMTGFFLHYGTPEKIVPSLVLLIRLVTIWFSTLVGFMTIQFLTVKKND